MEPSNFVEQFVFRRRLNPKHGWRIRQRLDLIAIEQRMQNRARRSLGTADDARQIFAKQREFGRLRAGRGQKTNPLLIVDAAERLMNFILGLHRPNPMDKRKAAQPGQINFAQSAHKRIFRNGLNEFDAQITKLVALAVGDALRKLHQEKAIGRSGVWI